MMIHHYHLKFSYQNGVIYGARLVNLQK